MVRKILPFVFLIAIVSNAISQDVSLDQKPFSDVVHANTRFAFKLFHESVERAPDQNVMVSPTALSLDFSLLQNAADADAGDQIASVFEFGDLSSEAINQQSLKLRQALIYDPPKTRSTARPRRGIAPPPVCCALPPEHLTLAGSLWTQPGLSFRQKFQETNRAFYGFQAIPVPDKGPAGAKAVNDWIARKTGGALANFSLSWEKDDFLLVDATSFKGSWFVPFPENDTHPGDFKLPNGGKKQVPMMARSGQFSYLRGRDFQAVQLNYYHATMYIFLPDESSNLKEFEQSLTSENFATWINDLSHREGHLELPRFQANYHADITNSLKAMGMDRPFTTFSSFARLVSNPEGAKLSRVLQAISLKVDEKGTEVVSVGVVGGVVGGIPGGPRPEPFRMIVDHPFFFAICDQQTRAILYMGAINDPSPLPSTR